MITKNKKRVAGYIRVSSSDQAKEGYSLDAQKRKIEEYSEFKEWSVFKIYEDAGISGKSIKGRKAFQDMINDAKNGKFSAILIFKLDRAFRNVKDALNTLDELSKIKVDFISLSENIDTTTAMGKFFFTVINAFAQLERELTGERLNLTLNKKFQDGVMVGKSPIGYKWSKTKKIMVIDNKKSDMIKDIFEMTAKGISYREICGKYKLKPQSYYNMIRNKVYIGIITFEGVEREGIHQPIIDKGLFYEVNKNAKT